jgi:hypothetical protein
LLNEVQILTNYSETMHWTRFKSALDRICNHCNTKKVDDEKHFPPTYAPIKALFYNICNFIYTHNLLIYTNQKNYENFPIFIMEPKC